MGDAARRQALVLRVAAEHAVARLGVQHGGDVLPVPAFVGDDMSAESDAALVEGYAQEPSRAAARPA